MMLPNKPNQKVLGHLIGRLVGMKVKSRDGEDLGKVIVAEEDYFSIEKGFFFPKDFNARYEDITDISDGEIYLNLSKSDIEPWSQPSYAGWSQVSEINEGRLPVHPQPERKIVHTEFKHFKKSA